MAALCRDGNLCCQGRAALPRLSPEALVETRMELQILPEAGILCRVACPQLEGTLYTCWLLDALRAWGPCQLQGAHGAAGVSMYSAEDEVGWPCTGWVDS